MHLAALNKLPFEIIDSSQVFERRNLRNQPKMINKLTKSWDKAQLKLWNRFVPNKFTISSPDGCHQRQFQQD